MTETLIALVTLLITLSIASERLVEIVKGFIPWLNEKSEDVAAEGRRRATLQALAVVAGVVTAFLSKSVIEAAGPAIFTGGSADWISRPGSILALGLLASGGSGFWNSILTYLTSLKELNQKILRQKPAELPKSAPLTGAQARAAAAPQH